MAEINKNLMRVLQVNQQVKAVTPNCETCGGPHSYSDCPATVGQTQNVYAAGAYQGSFTWSKPTSILSSTSLSSSGLPSSGSSTSDSSTTNTASSSGLGTLPSNTFTNPNEDMKGITTRSGTAYQGPTIPTTTSSLPPVVERETEVTKDTVHPTNNESTKDVQPPVVQTETPIPNFEPVVASIIKPVVAPIIEPVATPVSAAKPNLKPSIPYPFRLHDQKLRDKANDQKEKFFQIFKDLNFNISFVDALILMPKFGPIIKTLLTNKDKLSELARTSLNEHCLTVLLKKFPEKMWNKLSLPDLYPTCMTLELADRSISRPVGVAEDIYVKVGTIHFSADFVVVDFDADPRVPLILERSFLKTKLALIDVFKGELTLRVGKEAITFNLDQTLRYSANYNDMTVNRIDVIDMACEEYSQEVLGFSDVIMSGNPTPYYDPIVFTSSSNLTPFGESDFLLEEVDVFLALEDDPTSSEVDQYYEDFEPAFQHQRRVNPKIHDVIKQEVLKLLDARLIYPIFDSPWEKSHFMVKEGIVLGHKISKDGIEVDKAKVDVIAKLPHPTTVKGIRSFLGHAGFYRRFIKDFSKIAWPMTHLLEKDTPFLFSKECLEAFKRSKEN
uniref:Reverse transcriptase domain-containing protein n=1 Tax=Tanacetum cinerariifolium TaxID=118510 RepID=A0A699JAM5_TANCI|nr:reverse transcriptase domain-containing protein [Tanacetum cinerariifolium]